MKKLLMSAIIICFLGSLKSDNDTVSIYKQSLQLYLSNVNADTVYVLKCFDIKIPLKIGRHNILDIENSDRNLIKEKGSLYAVKIMPLTLRKDVIDVTLIEFFVSEENNERLMKNSGSQTFSYKYDMATSKYKLVKRTKNAI